tara:strand:- start:83 stop:589 length:507 start_codon:yes stop_codon:yes gene_type:complete
MFFWFVGTALIAMWFTFRDPAIDHRLVVLGALMPDGLDMLLGTTNFMHTLAAPILLLLVLMLATIGRRQLRRHVLAVPIGVFWHSVFDGAWMNTSLFWWPLTSAANSDVNVLLAEREVLVVVGMEIVGAFLLMWSWHLMGMTDASRRRLFLRSGRLDRSFIASKTKGL